ncbi:MAG: alpha/beta hydrolase [bacterium]|nr:alpha/beta hydrolase [Gammaproteobacteria bacterium]HIL98645.1 alpha/beta hydrolase [Pseudomonadales bacterium]
MPLNPVVDAMLQQMAEAGGPALHEMTPVEGRAMYRMMNEGASKEDLASVSDESANGVPVRVYRPTLNTKLPCLVYYHGGGWVIGDLETHDSPCRLLARQTGCVVVAVDYRLAPEHPFPVPLDDCFTATQWVVDNAARLGIDAEKVAVGGDSAGGNLAACVCIKAREQNGPSIVHQVLVYPVTDAAMDTESYVENADGYMLTRDSMVWFWDNYIGTHNKDNYLISPLKAEDLSDLPSATVLTAEFDPLRDEGESYGARLLAAGVATQVKRYDGLVHGFISTVDILDPAKEAVELIASRLKQAFND